MTTYAQLQADIASWLMRSDLTSSIPSFIRLAEARIKRRVRCRAMQVSETLSVSDIDTALPTGWIEFRSVSLDVEAQRKLRGPLSPHIVRTSTEREEGANPTMFAVEGENIIVAPVPDTAVDLFVVYYKAFDALEESDDTNWLLTNAYDIYLYASLRVAAEFLEDEALEDRYENKFNLAVGELENHEKFQGWGGGSLRAVADDSLIV